MTSRRSRARRVLGASGAVVGVAVTFVAATAAGAVLHLDVPATRRLVATQVSGLLAKELKGEVEIEALGGLGLRGIDGARVRVKDPDGVQVLLVDGLKVRIRALPAARSALLGEGDIRLSIPVVSIDHADVALDVDPMGDLRLSRALSPKETKAEEPKKEGGRGLRIEAPDLALGHAWVHGAPSEGGPVIDADVKDLAAHALVGSWGTRAGLDHVDIVTRGLPASADPRGRITASYEQAAPEGAKPRIAASFDGTAMGTLTLHAEAHGTLPYVKGEAKLALGKATVDIDADVTTDAAPTIDARLAARAIDLSRVAKGAPESELGLDAHASVVLGEAMHADVELDTLPGTLAGERVPPIAMRGSFTKDAAEATARIQEPSMPTEVRVSMRPADGDRVVVAHLRSHVPELRRLPELSRALDSGSAEVLADARLALRAKTVEARVAVTGRRIARGEQSVRDVHAEARVAGTLDRPVVDAAVHAEDVRAGGVDARTIDARTRVEPGEATVLRDPRVDVERAGEKIAVSAGLVRVAGSSLAIEGAQIEGLGEPIRAELSHGARSTTARLAAPRIDLAKVSRVVGRDLGIHEGRLSVAVDLDGRDLQLALEAQLDAAGRLAVHSKRLTLGGSPMQPASWARASGRIALEGDVDMAKLGSIVPTEAMPFGELRGELVIAGTIGRDSPTSAPELRLHAHTLGLVVSGKTPSEPAIPKRPRETEVKGIAPWRSDDVDIGLDVRNDATSGLTGIAFRVTDRQGVVTAFDAKSVVPYDEILAHPGQAKAKLVRAPISAKLVVPKRSLDRMPSALGLKNVSGDLEAQIDVDGTPIEPHVVMVGRAHGVRSGMVPAEKAAEADVALRYDGRAADLEVQVGAEKRRVLELATHVDARMEDLVEGRAGAAPAWTASSRLNLVSFPLEMIGALADRQIKGRASGAATIEGLHRDAKLAARVVVDGLSVGRAKYERARVDVDAVDGALAAKARFDQPDGFGEVSAEAGLVWGAAIVPALAPDRPIAARLVARSFRAAALQPFVAGTFDALDGRIDADARASISRTEERAVFDGRVVLRDGTVQLAAMGEELRSVRASASLRPDGTITVDDISARAGAGELSGDARLKLDGLRLATASANVRIPEKHAFDVAVNGQPLGEVFGEVKLDAIVGDDGKRTSLVVDVPRFDVTLPQSMKSGIQALDENEKIRVGVYREPNTLVRVPLDREDFRERKEEDEEARAAAEGSRLDIDVRLGRVQVERGNTLRATLTGNPKVTVAGGETRITGRIQVESGWADVQGKKFEIERGTITFNGEPEPNPIIVATAEWTAADDTRIYADFVGPLKTGKVTLRSEPPRPKNEILAMILFGTADGANPTPPPAGKQPNGTQRAALGIGGGFAAQGLTEALDDLTGIQATARIDTTSSNNPRPQVEFQISPRVSLEFTYVIGQPPVTEPPDKNLLTIDWRFLRNWSLESTFGDRGRQVFDLVWQRSY